MKIAIACDPAGKVLVEAVKEVCAELGHETVYLGINDGDTCRDYPVYGVRAARAVKEGKCDMGIILCGTGVGISMAANKVPGIRCCCCSDVYSAKLSREHNDANILSMGGRGVAPEAAALIARTFLETPFSGVDRHAARIRMLSDIEQGRNIE